MWNKKLLKIEISLILVNLINGVFSNCGALKNDYKVVTIESGPIRGLKQESIFAKTPYYSFRGIPYIKSPIGDLRFELPQKPDPWTEIKDVLKTGLDCLQERQVFGEAKGYESSEDCIFLNVYTPDMSVSKKLAVMFYIHGGGYQEGSSSEVLMGPDFLIDQNIVLVTVNYRLGPFGFLSLGTNELPKNIGLKDQQFALRWVFENIHNFGGDNTQVTIFGQSVGGAAVHFHMLSSESRKYFQRAIFHSGSANTYWAYKSKGYTHEKEMFQFAKNMGENITALPELIQFLKTVDAKVLFESTKTPIFTNGNGRRSISLTYSPVIEDESFKLPFLTKRPEELMQSNGIEMMIGYTSQEFIAMLPESRDPSLLKPFLERFDLNFPRNDFRFDYDSEIYQKMSKKVKEFYFPRGDILDTESALQYIDLFSDTSFGYPAELVARSNSNNNFNTFLYRFDVNDTLNMAKILSGIDIGGTGHGDELCYIFRCDELKDVYSTIDKTGPSFRTILLMTEMWSSFAKYGHPTNGTWNSFTAANQNRAYITNNGVSMTDENFSPANDANRRIAFWDNIFSEYQSFAKY